MRMDLEETCEWKNGDELQKSNMGKRPRRSENEHQWTIGVRSAGCSQKDVAQDYNGQLSTTCRINFKPLGMFLIGSVQDVHGKTTATQDRFIITNNVKT